jgi:hypothetical protein
MVDVSEWQKNVRKEYRRTFVEETRQQIDSIVGVFPESVRNEVRIEKYGESEDSADEGPHFGGRALAIEDDDLDETDGSWRAAREFVESLHLLSGAAAVFAPTERNRSTVGDDQEENGESVEETDDPVAEVMWTVQLVDQRFETLRSSFAGSISSKAKSKIKSVFGWIKNTLSSISTKLWNLVSSHTNLQEWSVTGGAGVSMFGLQGNADMSLTFGP